MQDLLVATSVTLAWQGGSCRQRAHAYWSATAKPLSFSVSAVSPFAAASKGSSNRRQVSSGTGRMDCYLTVQHSNARAFFCIFSDLRWEGRE
jgi:hypothetical protein